MKNTILLLMAGLALISCKQEEKVTTPPPNNGIFGRYELVEMLQDPGDGSGTFQPVTSNKTLELFTNGTITSNGNLCSMDPGTANPSSGVFSLADSSIVVAGCDTLNFDLDSSTLIINYPCIEPCRAKYQKSLPLFTE